MSDPLAPILACLQRNDLAGAERNCVELVQRDPGNADGWHLAGIIAHKQGVNGRAVEFIRKAIRMRPEEAQFSYNAGVIHGEMGENEEAERYYREAVRLDPNHGSAANNLGNLLRIRGAFGEALKFYQMGLAAEPKSARTMRAVGLAQKMIGDVEGAIGSFAAALALNPGDALTHSDFVFSHQYRIGIDAATLGEVHRGWDAKHGKGKAGVDYSPRRDAERQIRLGFVSPDLGYHPVGIFLAPLLERLDKERFHVTAYSDRSKIDAQSERIRAASAQWRGVKGATDDALFAQVQEDKIDILFDLAGHTDDNRMALFARRAAPLQMTWGGYVGTTGLAEMDYIVCDRHHVPAEVGRHYSERPLRLAHDYIAYDPPKYAPAIKLAPSVAAGHVTFGCMNNPTKINELVAEVWSEILHEVPGSRLLLKYKGFDDPAVEERVLGLFARHGIGSERIELLGSTNHVIHLEAYNRVDVILDPFPYSGGLTTCEALWMGVPTVTWPGDTFASRHSLAHMTNAGFTETIAGGREDYVRIAVEWSQDVGRRNALREGLREQVAASPLCDLAGHAESFSKEVERAWKQWCLGKAIDLAGTRVGLLGVGLMGKPAGKLLLEAGAEMVVWNRSAVGSDEMVKLGARAAGTVAELARMLEGGLIVMMLKDADAVREVATGSGGLLEGVLPGTLVLDMGTTSLKVTRWLGDELESRGCSLVDAPVSGGEKGAIEGTLTVMAGGSVADFERARPIFEVLGKRVTRMGETGAGQVAKLANQMIVATTIDAVAEALRMAEAAGVDPGLVRDALRGGFAESRVLEMHGERMVRGDFAPGGKATGQLKDLRYAEELAGDLGIELPGLGAQVKLWEQMIEAGMGELDHSGIYAYLGELNRKT